MDRSVERGCDNECRLTDACDLLLFDCNGDVQLASFENEVVPIAEDALCFLFRFERYEAVPLEKEDRVNHWPHSQKRQG